MSVPYLYTRAEVAEKLKVEVRTVDRWRREGILVGKKIGRMVRFSEEEVLRLLKKSK